MSQKNQLNGKLSQISNELKTLGELKKLFVDYKAKENG